MRVAVGLLIVLAGSALVLPQLGCCGCWGGSKTAVTPATLPAATRPTPRADLLAGQWVGQWSSDSNGMDGALRCQITKLEENTYAARFQATFAKFFTHNSVVTLKVHENGDVWKFAGEKDLGVLNGGVYKYNGQANGEEFVSSYDSSMDKGTFRMKRSVTTATSPTTTAVLD